MTFTHSLKKSHDGKDGMVAEAWGSSSYCICRHRVERDEDWYSASFLFLILSGIPACRIVLPASRWGLSALINLSEKTHHRHAQKFIYPMCLDPISLTILTIISVIKSQGIECHCSFLKTCNWKLLLLSEETGNSSSWQSKKYANHLSLITSFFSLSLCMCKCTHMCTNTHHGIRDEVRGQL